ncbi:MAG TPA: TetR family transcriptional regulator C-terminal domain-containing protein, partial [Dehalococcoidia bacterium]|nr:TetR family transcriptional regulator C-terminal domain-containing protein [Dehalococcoidia bacterium]
TFRRAVGHTQPVADNVRTILSGVFGLLRDDPLWGSLFAEFGAHALRNEKVRQRLATMYDRWRELIADILSEGREAGRIRTDIDVEFIATVLIAAVEGSIMQSRLAPETVRLDEMLEPLTTILTEWLTPRV